MIKVLVVEDDKLVRKGLVSAMPWNEFGMLVVGEASNGEKAMEFLELNKVDLLLTDLSMPVMSGIELMKAVRKSFPYMHIVVLTLHQDFEYIQEAMRLGALDYLAKVQLEQERFEEVLERIINRIKEQENLIRDYREKVSFYDYDPTNHKVMMPVRHGNQQPQDRTEISLTALKEQWQSQEWIFQEAHYHHILGELKALQLPQAKLIGFLYSLTDRWNRLFNQINQVNIQLQGSFDSWLEVEDWFNETREFIRHSMGKSSFSQEVTQSVIRGVDLLHEEIGNQITAADIAKRVNMSRSYFSQCFKEIVGKNFNEYLRHIRTEKAKEYLLYTSKTILWIAENVGYMDEKYFSRSFREQTGRLPSEYRQANQEGRIPSDK